MYACSSLENSRIKLTESGNSAVDIVILELGYVLQMDGGEGVGYDKVWCIKMLERKFSCWLAYIINVSCYADPLPPTPSPLTPWWTLHHISPVLRYMKSTLSKAIKMKNLLMHVFDVNPQTQDRALFAWVS